MGEGTGGTTESLSQGNILINFTFEPKGTKKSIDNIIESRNIGNPEMADLMRTEADRMVETKFLLQDQDGTFVFTKDNQNQYYWEKAGIIDTIRAYAKRYFD